jgi:hypothetical protein
VSKICDGAEEFSRQATVLSLGSALRGDIVALNEDAFPLPVGMRNAEGPSSTSFRLVVRPAARAAHVGLAAGGVAFILQR